MATTITRMETEQAQPPRPRMSQIVIHGDTVYLAGQVADFGTTAGIKEQTRQVLAKIDALLAQAGTDKSKLLRANLWIKDMRLFREMTEVWNEWVDSENPPARACIEADMAYPELLVEIMVIAAR